MKFSHFCGGSSKNQRPNVSEAVPLGPKSDGRIWLSAAARRVFEVNIERSEARFIAACLRLGRSPSVIKNVSTAPNAIELVIRSNCDLVVINLDVSIANAAMISIGIKSNAKSATMAPFSRSESFFCLTTMMVHLLEFRIGKLLSLDLV